MAKVQTQTRKNRRMYTKGLPGRNKARVAYYKKFRNGNNPVNRSN